MSSSPTFALDKAADHLRDRDDVRNYLDAMNGHSPGDGGLIRATLNDIARTYGVAQISRETGLSPSESTKRWPRIAAAQAVDPDAGRAGIGAGIADYSAASGNAVERRQPIPPHWARAQAFVALFLRRSGSM